MELFLDENRNFAWFYHDIKIWSISYQKLNIFGIETCITLVLAGAQLKFELKSWIVVGWSCRSIGYYRAHSLHDISFSYDGSVLGALFGSCVTLWDSNTNEMKCSLAKGPEPLRYEWIREETGNLKSLENLKEFGSNFRKIEFAHGDCPFIVIACSETTLFAWNVINLTLLWKLELNISFLVADPRSDHIAVFTTDNSCKYTFNPLFLALALHRL